MSSPSMVPTNSLRCGCIRPPCWPVGQISFGTGDVRTRVERFPRHGANHDGKVVDCPSPHGNSALRGVAMLSHDDGWAVGCAGASTLVVHWDDHGLTTVNPVVRPRDNVASALEDLTAETHHMIAVGWHVGARSPEQQPAAYLATD
ncbi:hypothetical protein [Actinophytocola sp.]|uniref:hypothetical protein n=1 Tax=Actinophytocola sp. TaxID=1872138 RepID=UPI0038998086